MRKTKGAKYLALPYVDANGVTLTVGRTAGKKIDPIEVRNSGDRGRGTFATREIHAGDDIVDEETFTDVCYDPSIAYELFAFPDGLNHIPRTIFNWLATAQVADRP